MRKVTDLTANEGIVITSKKEAKKIVKLFKEAGLTTCANEEYDAYYKTWYAKAYGYECVFLPAKGTSCDMGWAHLKRYTLQPASDFFSPKEPSLPKYWVVKAPEGDRTEFKETVIKYLNKEYGTYLAGDSTPFPFYGYGGGKLPDCEQELCDFRNGPILLTLEDFKATREYKLFLKSKEVKEDALKEQETLAEVEKEILTFPREMIVWNDPYSSKFLRMVLAYDTDFKHPYLTINPNKDTGLWHQAAFKYAEELPTPETITIVEAEERLSTLEKPVKINLPNP